MDNIDRSVITSWLKNGMTPADIYAAAVDVEQKNKEKELSQAMEGVINGYNNYYKILTGEPLPVELANKLSEKLTTFTSKTREQNAAAAPTKEKEPRKAGTSDEDKAFAEALQKLLRNW